MPGEVAQGYRFRESGPVARRSGSGKVGDEAQREGARGPKEEQPNKIVLLESAVKKKKAPAATGAATQKADQHNHPYSTSPGRDCQTPKGYVVEAKRHVDFTLALLAMPFNTADVFPQHLHRFADIFANALVDPERDVLCEYIRDRIGKIGADKRPQANRLFFGDVVGAK